MIVESEKKNGEDCSSSTTKAGRKEILPEKSKRVDSAKVVASIRDPTKQIVVIE